MSPEHWAFRADIRPWHDKLRDDLANIKAGTDGLFGYPVHLIDWERLDDTLRKMDAASSRPVCETGRSPRPLPQP